VQVQLFAAASRAVAEQFAADLDRRLPPARGQPVAVQSADSAGRAVYRVLVGRFPSEAEAGRFCAQVKAAGQDCMIRR
jgi:hypothetical protein